MVAQALTGWPGEAASPAMAGRVIGPRFAFVARRSRFGLHSAVIAFARRPPFRRPAGGWHPAPVVRRAAAAGARPLNAPPRERIHACCFAAAA
jgi:hypothetical protein